MAGAEIFFFSVAAQGDHVRVLAEEQDVWDGAGFAGFDELILERAGCGVGQEACVHLPASFFWLLHETVAVFGGSPPIRIALTAQARLPMLPKPLPQRSHRALVIDAQAAHGIECVAHCFPDCGMGVNGGGHVVECGFQAHGCNGLGDNFRGQGADGVHAQDFAVLFFGYHFYEAFVLAENGGFAVAEEREFSGLHLEAGVASLFFGEADGTDLRLAVGAVGAALAIEGLDFFSGHAPNGDDAFHGSGVRELRQAGDDVSYGVEVRLVGFQEGVGVNEAALEPGFGFFEADIFGERAAADGDENLFGADSLRFSGFVFVNDCGAVCVFLHGLDFGFEFDFHALFHEGFVQLGGNFLVFERDDARERFEQGDFRAEGVENGCEFDAYRAAAHHDHGFRDLLQAEDFAVGEDRGAVNFNARQGARLRTGGQQDVRGFEFGDFAVFFHGDAPGTGDFAPADDGFDFILFEEQADAAGMFLYDFVFAREDGGPIDFDVFHFEAEFFGAFEVVVDVRVVQKNFGGDAADVQAGAAEEWVFFDDGNFQAPLRGADGGDVSARSAADDHDIVFSQTSPPPKAVRRAKWFRSWKDVQDSG